MNATTIKIENPLLKNLLYIVPQKKSLSAFVREVLEREIQRQKMILAAESYLVFLKSHADESQSLEEWESADLGRPPKHLRKKGKNS